MGFEIAILGLITTAASAVSQHRAGKKAAAARSEARSVSTANEKNQDRLNRRKSAREERIRRAQVANTAENRGTSGSSGELGALSGISGNVGASVANQSSQARAAEGISAQQQIASNAEQQAENAKLFGDLIQTGLGVTKEFRKKE